MANNPYVNKVTLGNQTLIDITDTTATANDVAQGKYFYTAAGAKTAGAYQPSGVLPTGGTAGQVLTKESSTDYDADWETLPDTVHVGTAAPSDPAIKIWLDTDEQGQSAVTSVNGASGAVVFDADDMNAMHWDLLWENASPSSSFAAQTVSLDLSNYTFVIIGFRWSDSANQISWHVCIVGETNKITRADLGATKVWVARRAVQVSATGVTFADADQGSSTSDPYTTNAELIPVLIYGIRGIIAT